MFNDVSNEPKTSFLFESRNVDTFKSGKQQKGLKKRRHVDENKQKIISIASTQEEHMPKSIGCRIRMLVGYDMHGEMNATIITTKKEVDYQFW